MSTGGAATSARGVIFSIRYCEATINGACTNQLLLCRSMNSSDGTGSIGSLGRVPDERPFSKPSRSASYSGSAVPDGIGRNHATSGTDEETLRFAKWSYRDSLRIRVQKVPGAGRDCCDNLRRPDHFSRPFATLELRESSLHRSPSGVTRSDDRRDLRRCASRFGVARRDPS